MASSFTSKAFVSVAVIAALGLCATRFRSVPKEATPLAVVSETSATVAATSESEPTALTTRSDLGEVPHRVRDHAGAARAHGGRLRESATSRREKY